MQRGINIATKVFSRKFLFPFFFFLQITSFLKSICLQIFVFIGNNTQNEKNCDRLRMVWVSCHGATAADEEYLGPMRYTPTQGFPAKFFPFYNQQLYLRYKYTLQK